MSFDVYEEEKVYSRMIESGLKQRIVLEQLLPMEDVCNIFSNLEMLAQLSKLLRCDLRVRIVEWKPASSIVDAFLLIAQALRMFALNMQRLPLALETLQRCRQEQPAVAKALGLAALQDFYQLSDVLLLPSKRLEKYASDIDALLATSDDENREKGERAKQLIRAVIDDQERRQVHAERPPPPTQTTQQKMGAEKKSIGKRFASIGRKNNLRDRVSDPK